MNEQVNAIQSAYRSAREEYGYGIIDIERIMCDLAIKGMIWPLKGMKDLTESESILIDYHICKHFEKQVYDNHYYSTQKRNDKK